MPTVTRPMLAAALLSTTSQSSTKTMRTLPGGGSRIVG